MRWSQYFLPTLREDPKDSDSASYRLMVRAGLIRRLGAGAYSYLPFGRRALRNAETIVREEMDRAGAQELLLPALQPVELWKATGRYEVLGDVLIRFKDRTGKEVALGPTHEEVVTSLLKEVQSHKQLPVTVYQIQTKFRDEPRPRFGVIRSKEFLMKDAYSFDTDLEGLNRSYQAMYEAYQRIFARCGVQVLACEADSGIMGGDVSHEFMAPAESGEDQVVRCEQCAYAANLEAAKIQPPASSLQPPAEAPKALQAVKTPGKHTVEQVSQFLKVTPQQLVKTLLYDVGKDGKEHVAVLVRGDHEVSEAKLARALQSAHVKLSSAQTIERLSKAPMGFAGPVKLDGVRLLADHAVTQMVNAVTGANEAETHLINVNPGRDFSPSTVADLRLITQADGCPKCGARLAFVKAIEVGHVFKLGTKYTQALGAVVQDAGGALAPMIMGCYGIGVNRIVAAAVEQHHDAQGIVWPTGLAPFHAVVTILDVSLPEQRQAGEQAYEALRGAGFQVLLDDREQSAGSKLKDADLVGIPWQVVVGKVWQAEHKLELRRRSSKEPQRVEPGQLVEALRKALAPAHAEP
ncbi:MAG: proline--tRNA ligase [Candidatus Omnitrophica bacterium]|nr:proline--tRNA ligase [Candidatus Omnitrophota bacterium]